MVIELGDSHCCLKFGNFPILRCLNLGILCFFHGMFSSILLPSLYFPIFSLEFLVKFLVLLTLLYKCVRPFWTYFMTFPYVRVLGH